MDAIRRPAQRAALGVLCFIVAACSGGAGGGMASTPAPPPPAGANVNLLGPLKSETFANQAVQGNFTINTAGPTSGSTAPVTANFVYDASTQSYAISAGNASHTFAPTDIDAKLTNAAETVYDTTSGNVTDSLTVTKPGTSGRFTYEYVGAAFWQDTVEKSASSATITLDALAYGEPTLSTAVPKTGQAAYSIDLIGGYSGFNNFNGVTGQGTIQVNFATSGLAINGLLDGAGTFSGYGKIASAGSFTGPFSFSADGAQSGTVNGQFYGPAAQEIGATFATTDGTQSATGVIIGRQDSTLSAPVSFNGLLGNTLLAPADEVSQSGKAAGSIGTMGVSIISNTLQDQLGLFSKDYTYATIMSGNWPLGTTGMVGNAVSAIAGQKTVAIVAVGDSYVETGLYYDTTGTTPYYDFFTFGFATPPAALPPTGFAGYDIAMQGIVTPASGNVTTLSGAGALTVDFATGAISTSGTFLSPSAVSGAFSGSGTLTSSTDTYVGAITFNGADVYNGNFQGRFYGPAAGSTGGVFAASATSGGQLIGAFTGTVDSTILNPATTLLNLPATTTFLLDDAGLSLVLALSPRIGLFFANNLTQIVFDPATNTYTISPNYSPGGTINLINATLGPANIDQANSNATFTAYGAPDVTARILNTGPTNPTIQLSYVSFADVVQTGTSAIVNGETFPSEHFLVFGLQTNRFQMPVTGTARYSGIAAAVGAYSNGAQTFAIDGTGQLSANFGTGLLTGSLALEVTGSAGAPAQSLGSMTLNGSITGATFGTAISQTSGGITGSLMGGFYGPQANEVGATFYLNLPANPAQNNAAGTAVGAFVAKKG